MVKDHVHLNIPIAYVVLNHREQTTDYTIIETKIKTYILSATSEYNVPKKFYFVDRIPILPNVCLSSRKCIKGARKSA